MRYKGIDIDTSAIYGDKCSINWWGEDFIFDTLDEAKEFINNEIRG